MSKVAIDWTGVRIGKLVGVRPHKKSKKYILWVFRCDCGKEKIIFPSQRNWQFKNEKYNVSCGCTFIGCKNNASLGKYFHIFKKIQGDAVRKWEDYSVFEKDISAFYKYGKRLVKKNYSKPFGPNNFKFVPCDRSITFNGETHGIREWAELIGVSRQVLSARINKLGWSTKRALTSPLAPCGRKKRTT